MHRYWQAYYFPTGQLTRPSWLPATSAFLHLPWARWSRRAPTFRTLRWPTPACSLLPFRLSTSRRPSVSTSSCSCNKPSAATRPANRWSSTRSAAASSHPHPPQRPLPVPPALTVVPMPRTWAHSWVANLCPRLRDSSRRATWPLASETGLRSRLRKWGVRL